jgi:hypothetical protein
MAGLACDRLRYSSFVSKVKAAAVAAPNYCEVK